MTTATRRLAPPMRADAPPKAPLPRVAFILSQFPEVHETFILRELLALDSAGLDFVILSLKPCRDSLVQSGARGLLDRTYYPWDAPGGIRRWSRSLRRQAAMRNCLPWLRKPLASMYVTWAAERFARLCEDLDVGHIHSHWATAPTSAAVLVSHLVGVPYSFTAHAWDIFAGDGLLAEKARRAKFIITCTGANVQTIRSMIAPGDHGKVILNYHGVPFTEKPYEKSRRSDRLRVAAVGRLVETKGFEYLLAALEEARFPFELVIVGYGPLRRDLEKRAARGACRGRVRFEGIVPNERVFEILSQSDVFVMPSVVARNGDRDGIPNVMLEAMSVGLPVVASDISGIGEAVVDSRTGILVPPASPSAIRRGLMRFWNAPDEAAKMGLAGRRLVRQRFSAEKNARALYDVFAKNLVAGVR